MERFEKGDRVMTPQGAGTFDGYGYPPGRPGSVDPVNQWVWLDARDSGGHLKGYRLDADIQPLKDDADA